MRFDPYSVDPADEYLAEGGTAAAARHDPTGHEDCAREWQPCDCHGDRLCTVGSLMRWWRMERSHTEWMAAEEAPRLRALAELTEAQRGWLAGAELDIRRSATHDARWAAELAWPMRVNAAAWRHAMYEKEA
jgi:hypothetical protein